MANFTISAEADSPSEFGAAMDAAFEAQDPALRVLGAEVHLQARVACETAKAVIAQNVTGEDNGVRCTVSGVAYPNHQPGRMTTSNGVTVQEEDERLTIVIQGVAK